jgi:hypothetical protein
LGFYPKPHKLLKKFNQNFNEGAVLLRKARQPHFNGKLWVLRGIFENVKQHRGKKQVIVDKN